MNFCSTIAVVEKFRGDDNIASSRLLRTFNTLFLVMTFLNVVVLFVNEKHYYFVTAILVVSYSCCLADPATAKRPTMENLGEFFFFFIC